MPKLIKSGDGIYYLLLYIFNIIYIIMIYILYIIYIYIIYNIYIYNYIYITCISMMLNLEVQDSTLY